MMQTKTWPFAVLAGLIVAVVVVLGWQRRTTERLRNQITTQRTAAGEWAQLNAEHQRLSAAQVMPEELEKLEVDRHAVTALWSEIENMKRRAEGVASINKTPVPPKMPQLSMKNGPIAALLWKNAGQATPEAVFETALWAGAGGNVESLAGLLFFDADSQARAKTIFAKLPATMQQELATPERLIALLVARDVPLGSAEILTQITPVDPAADTKLHVKLTDPEGKSKEAYLSLQRQDGAWHFVVPPKAVERYATLLQTPVTTR